MLISAHQCTSELISAHQRHLLHQQALEKGRTLIQLTKHVRLCVRTLLDRLACGRLCGRLQLPRTFQILGQVHVPDEGSNQVQSDAISTLQILGQVHVPDEGSHQAQSDAIRRFKSSGRCTYLIGEAISIAISVAMRVAITMASDDVHNHDGV